MSLLKDYRAIELGPEKKIDKTWLWKGQNTKNKDKAPTNTPVIHGLVWESTGLGESKRLRQIFTEKGDKENKKNTNDNILC